MNFFVVTPTFNSFAWLPQCVRSVAAQASLESSVSVCHFVQDGCSTDGTRAWLREWKEAHPDTPGYRFRYVSERDAGMYDAINKAWAHLPDDADWVAHLNSDEQYLPGALQAVVEAASARPGADVYLAQYVILDKDYRYIAHRLPVAPRAWSSWYNCACITNASFHRAARFREHGIRFDTRWKSIGDLVFFRDLTRAGLRFCLVDHVTSAFICTGGNLAWSEASWREGARYAETIPAWARRMNPVIYRWVNFKRLLRGWRAPLSHSYRLYLPGEDAPREFPIFHPTVRWKFRTVSSEPPLDAFPPCSHD